MRSLSSCSSNTCFSRSAAWVTSSVLVNSGGCSKPSFSSRQRFSLSRLRSQHFFHPSSSVIHEHRNTSAVFPNRKLNRKSSVSSLYWLTALPANPPEAPSSHCLRTVAAQDPPPWQERWQSQGAAGARRGLLDLSSSSAPEG